jgi:hypothetical protein
MEFKEYQRTIPTKARRLTEEDYVLYKGLIETLEGSQPFSPGDYLGQDAKGEWPIKQTTIEEKYIQVAPEDNEGFALYIRPGRRLAAQMPEPFTIEGMHGKAGDYLVLGGEGGWPVDREIFEQTYTLFEQESKEV